MIYENPKHQSAPYNSKVEPGFSFQLLGTCLLCEQVKHKHIYILHCFTSIEFFSNGIPIHHKYWVIFQWHTYASQVLSYFSMAYLYIRSIELFSNDIPIHHKYWVIFQWHTYTSQVLSNFQWHTYTSQVLSYFPMAYLYITSIEFFSNGIPIHHKYWVIFQWHTYTSQVLSSFPMA